MVGEGGPTGSVKTAQLVPEMGTAVQFFRTPPSHSPQPLLECAQGLALATLASDIVILNRYPGYLQMGQLKMRSRPHFVPAVTGSANQVPSPGSQGEGHQDWALGPGRGSVPQGKDNRGVSRPGCVLRHKRHGVGVG